MTADRGSARWWLLVGVLAALAFVAAIAVQRNVFPFYSGDHDEPVYRYQAEMLADGELTIPGSQNEFFRPWLSGPRGDRLVMAFQPLWPAALMVADEVFGSMLVALGAAAALAVVACFLLARELSTTVARAAGATALFALTPFVLVLSGTYLNYVFTLALGSLLGFCVLRGLRTGSRVSFTFAGALIGLLLLTRPLDTVLYALPLVGFAIASRRPHWRGLARPAAWAVAGLLPFLIVALVYNIEVNGGPLTFSTTVQSDGWSAFGWGERSIDPYTLRIDYTVGYAVTALGQNLWAVPTWMLGTYAALALAGFGAVRTWQVDRARFGLLVAMTFVFPLAYLTWWATALTIPGARNGLGPHYYLPMVVPLAILTAHGAAELLTRRPLLLGTGLLVSAIVLTAVALAPKAGDKRFLAGLSRTYAEDVRTGLKARDGARALVVLERAKAPYVMDPWPFLANQPDLDGDVLYAVDRGARNIDLIERFDGWRTFRLVSELPSGSGFERAPVHVKPQSVVRGRRLTLTTTVTNTNGAPTVIAYVCRGRHVERRLLDTRSRKGASYQVTWMLEPKDTDYEGAPARTLDRDRKSTRHGRCGPGRADNLVVGASFGNGIDARDPDRAEWRTYARTTGRGERRRVEALTAPEQWLRFGGKIGAWLPAEVEENLSVGLEAPQT